MVRGDVQNALDKLLATTREALVTNFNQKSTDQAIQAYYQKLVNDLAEVRRAMTSKDDDA